MPGAGCLPAVTGRRRDGGRERTYRRDWPVARTAERRMMTAEREALPGLPACGPCRLADVAAHLGDFTATVRYASGHLPDTERL
jgi:hypothetical protein